MSGFTNKHPTDLTKLVGVAVANGATAARVRAQLADGTFNGWPTTYDMPLETVRYYGKREKQRRAGKTITPEARENPKRAVDDLARLLLSAAQKGLERARPSIDTDPKALKEWGDALKTINSLVSDTARETKPAKRSKTPQDPLTARLTSPSLPTAKKDTKATTETKHEPPLNPADFLAQPQTEPQPAAGFLQKPAIWGSPASS